MGVFDDFVAKEGTLGEAAAKRADLIQGRTSAIQQSQMSGGVFDDFAAPTTPGVDTSAQLRTSAIPTAVEQQPIGTRPDNEGFFERMMKEPKYLGSALERGWNNIKMSVNGSQLAEYGELLDSFNKAYTPEQIAADPKLQEEKRLRETKFAELAQENSLLQKENENILKSDRTRPETQRMMGVGKGQTGWMESAADVGAAIARDPGSVVDLAISSGPTTLASAASALLAFFATRNPRIAAGAGGTASGYAEFGSEYAENRADGMSHDEAWKKASLKAGVVGALDAVSMGTAGKSLDLISDALKVGATRTAVKEVGKETGRQAALGAAGEAGGSLAAGKDIDPRSVLLEAVGETVSAPVEAVSTRGKLNTATSPEQQLSAALDRGVRDTQFTPEGVDQQVRRALDPNMGQEQRREVSQTPLTEIADQIAPLQQTAPAEQGGTAVAPAVSQPEEQPVEPVAQNMSPSVSLPMSDAADQALQQNEQQLLADIDAQQQEATNVVVDQPDTLTAALDGIARDLQLQEGETLNVSEVTTDKRLNKFASALSQAFGVNVHWVDFGEQGMTTNTGRNLGGFNGYRLGDTVLISPNQDFMDTTWHELTHTLETKHPEVYAQLRDTILRTVDPAMKQRLYETLNQRRQQEVGRDMSASELESELVAVVTGQQAANPQLLQQLFDGFQDKTLAQQFRDILVEILDKLSAALRGPQYIKDRQRITQTRDAIKSAFAEYQKRTAQTAPQATMPPALAQKVAISKGATNAAQVGQVQQGGVQQRQGVDGQLQPQGNNREQQASQPASSPQTGTGNRTGQGGAFSREGLIEALAEGKPVSVTDLIGHADIFTVYQNTRTLIRRAPVVKVRFDNRMRQLADREGMILKAGPVKKLPRAFAKIWYDYAGDHTKIGDIVRSTLVVQDFNDLPELVRAVESFFPGVSVKRNGWDLTAPVHPSGYRDVFFKGAAISGFPVELQMNFDAMLSAKEIAHKLYVREELLRRQILSQENPMSVGDIEAARDEINQLQMQQFEVYSEAAQSVFDRANMSRQSPSDMGTPSEVQVDRPNERGAASPVRGLASQADKVPLGARVTGTPLTSKNVVPAGKEAGMDISVPPTAIPNRIVTQQGVEDKAPAGQFSRSTVPMMQMSDADARRELGLDPKKNNVRNVGAALNSKTVSEDGVIGDKDNSEKAMEEIADILVGEVSYQLGATAATGTGLGWYSANYPNAVRRLARVYPEFETDAGARNVFTAIVAITSNGEKVTTNISNALKIYDRFRDGEPLQPVGTRRGSMANVLDRLQALIDQFGMDNFHEHLLEELTVGEINASLRADGKKAQSSYTADTIMPRAALYFGPKLGAFYANLMGSEGYLTMDLWWSRTFNRIRGTLIPEPTQSSINSVRELLGLPEDTDDELVALSAIPYMESYKEKGFKNGTDLERKANTLVKNAFLELNEAPFRASDRSFMIGTTLMAQRKLASNGVKLTLADIQAALWYYEKRLYAKLTGRKSDDIGYEEAILSYAEGDRPQRPAARFNRGRVGGTVGERGGAEAAANVSLEDYGVEPLEDRPEVNSTGQFSRALVQDAVEGKPNAPDLFLINENPAVLTAVGAPDEALVISKRTAQKVANPEFVGKSTQAFQGVNSAGFVVQRAPRIALTVDELRAVPRMLGNPVAVIRVLPDARLNRRESYKVVLDLVKDGNPVIAIVQPGVSQRAKTPFRASEIASIYPVNQESSLRETNAELGSRQLLYFNKGKAVVLASKVGRKLPNLTSPATGTMAKKPGDVRNLDYDIHKNSNFSRSMTEDMQAQEVFLEERARQAGFDNIDAWIDADYDSFIKAATEWRSKNPVEEGFFARRVAVPGSQYTLPARTIKEKYFENLFTNRMSRVEDIQQAVQQQGGTLDIRDAAGNVVGSTDITSAAQRMRGAVRGQLDRFKKEVETPLIEDAAKAGVNLDEVAQYLYALYAPERNLIIQTRNSAQFPTDGGSGMTNAEAAQIVASFRARPDFRNFDAIARRFQNITNMTQDVLLRNGLVDQQTITQWKQENPNYVPLRGFENVDPDSGKALGVGSPGRLDPRNPFVKVAKGRESRAANILENVLKDYADAVVLAEKNKVYRLLLQFVRDNPDNQLWEINAPAMNRTYVRNQLQSPLGYAMGEVRISFDVNDNPNETIAVRVNGRPIFIKVRDEGMLDDMKLTGSIGSGDQAKLFFRVWGGTMSYLAKIRTTLSPAFVLIDAFRNAETGGFYNLVKYGPGQAARAYARMFKAAQVAWKAERDGNWTGNAAQTITIRPPGQQPQQLSLKELYDMYRADGGKVGYLDIKEIEDIQKDIQTRFRAAQVAGSLDPRTFLTQGVNLVGKVEDVMLDAAGSIETAMRFATYMNRLEAGATRQEATNAAKNVTVNFDAKGKWTPQLGMLYMFANANVQGARQTFDLIFKSGKAGAILGGSLIGLGYALAQLGSAASGDDDQPYWDKELFKQAKIKNLLFFLPDGDTVTIPMAYGTGFFVNLGYALSDLQRGVPLAKVGAFMRDSFFTHFSPFGSMENVATFLAPTLLDPVIVTGTNKTEQGLPLLPESPYEPSKPDSEKFWSATRGTMFQQLSQYLNEATGGTAGYSGKIDVSPETMRYWYGWITGGAGGLVRDAADTMMLTSEIGFDTAVDKNKVPILRSFYQNNTGKADQMEFNKNAIEAERAIDEWKKLYNTEKRKEPAVAARLREERKLQELGSAVDDYKKALSVLRKQEIEIIDKRTSGRYDTAEAEDRLQRIADQKNKLYVRFNKAFYRASPETPGK